MLKRNDLDATAGSLDFALGRSRVGVELDGELLFELAITKYLDAVEELGDQPILLQRSLINHFACRKHALEVGDIDHREIGAEGVLEAALGHATKHRHLAAFETQ